MSFTVLTWNIQWQFGDWESRQSPILDTLREVDADIVCLQETWPDQVAGFADALGFEHHWSGRAPRNDPDAVGFGNAILSRWEISRRDDCFLEDAEGRKYRTIAHARVEAPFGRIPVFTTHLHYQYDGSAVRQMQLATASEFIEVNAGGDLPPILTGDMNAVPDSDEVRKLTGRSTPFVDGRIWTDAWEFCGEGSGVTWSNANPYLPNTAWPNRRLDYVFVGWPRENRPIGNPEAVWLVGDEPVAGVIAADHYGVAARICTEAPGAAGEA